MPNDHGVRTETIKIEQINAIGVFSIRLGRTVNDFATILILVFWFFGFSFISSVHLVVNEHMMLQYIEYIYSIP